ncbi:MAG: methyltransferase domain-containing protein [Lachnospiraceae bacterium]|nr:methyltransferase domain-containing protein [Lachnospiraceae bacterium]
MKLPGYYSSGEFAALAHVSLRTIRFYDKKNILKPTYVNPNGARFYTAEDLVRLQQILLLKYLGFSLEEIKEMVMVETDRHFLLNHLSIQKRLVQERMEQMQMVAGAIDNAVSALETDSQVDWSSMLELIHLTGMEQSLNNQYRNASNISARIRLHRDYSLNRQGWFPWIFEQCDLRPGMNILEIGCGNGALWSEHVDCIPEDTHIILSDISEGMIRDVRRNIGEEHPWFSFESFDCAHIPHPDASFDLVIAGHVLFYCDDIPAVCREICRVLRPGGRFICSTYGRNHMKEITELVQAFDKNIVLSAEALYERFGLENGGDILSTCFPAVEKRLYEDAIHLDRAEPLIEYILSCHGNQNHILLERYKDFRSFVEQQTSRSFHITKEAGIFLCRK